MAIRTASDIVKDVFYNIPYRKIRLGIITRGLYQSIPRTKQKILTQDKNSDKYKKYYVDVAWIDGISHKESKDSYERVEVTALGYGICYTNKNSGELVELDEATRENCYANPWGIQIGLDKGTLVLCGIRNNNTAVILSCIIPMIELSKFLDPTLNEQWTGTAENNLQKIGNPEKISKSELQPGDVKLRSKKGSSVILNDKATICSKFLKGQKEFPDTLQLRVDGTTLKTHKLEIIVANDDLANDEKAKITIDKDGNVIIKTNGEIRLGENATNKVVTVSPSQEALWGTYMSQSGTPLSSVLSTSSKSKAE